MRNNRYFTTLLILTSWLAGSLATRAVEPQAVAPRLMPQLGHTGRISLLRFAPNGKWLLSGSFDGSAILWDYASMRKLHHLQRSEGTAFLTGQVVGADFARDSQRVAVYFNNSGNLYGESGVELSLSVALWDLVTGRELLSLGSEDDGMRGAALSPGGTLLATGGKQAYVRLWDVATGKETRRLNGSPDGITEVAFSADGKWLVGVNYDSTVILWDVATGRAVRQFGKRPTLPLPDGSPPLAMRRAKFAPQGGALLVWGGDELPRLWDEAQVKTLMRIAVAPEKDDNFVFSPDGKLLGQTGQTVAVWNVATGEQLHEFRAWVAPPPPEPEPAPPAPPAPPPAPAAPPADWATSFEKLGKLIDSVIRVGMGLFGGQNPPADAGGACDEPPAPAAPAPPAPAAGAQPNAEPGLFDFLANLPSLFDFSEAYRPDWWQVRSDGCVFLPGELIAFGHGEEVAVCDLRTGKELRKFAVQDKDHWLHAAAFSRATGEFLGAPQIASPAEFPAEGDYRWLWLARWNLANGQRSDQLSERLPGEVALLSFTPDGKGLVAGTGKTTLTTWTGQQRGTRQSFSTNVGEFAVALSADRTRLLASYYPPLPDQLAAPAEMADEPPPAPPAPAPPPPAPPAPRGPAGEVPPVEPPADIPPTVPEQPRSQPVALFVYDIATKKQLAKIDAEESQNIFYSGELHHNIVHWIGADGVPLLQRIDRQDPPIRLVGHEGSASSLALSSDETWALTGGVDQTVRFWEVATGKLRATAKVEGKVQQVLISPDRKRYLTVHTLEALPPPDPNFPGLEPRLETVAIVERMHDAATGKLLWQRKLDKAQLDAGDGDYMNFMSPDGRWLLELSPLTFSSKVVDAATGKDVATLPGHSGGALAGAFSPDGKLVATADEVGVIRLWELPSGKPVCQLLSFENGDWAVVDAAGRYDSSGGGDIQGLHWVVKNEPIDLAQLKERYYEPGLFDKILGSNVEPLRKVEAFQAPQLHPEIAVVEPTSERPKLGIKLTNRGGGIGRVVVSVNGKEITADARGSQVAKSGAATMDLFVDLPPDHPLLVPGANNVIRVTAFNADGYLSSRGVERIYRTPAVARPPTQVWGIMVGVSDYRGDKIDLQFAAKDADDFGRAVQLAAGRLFGAEQARVEVYATNQSSPARQPTREQVLAALERVAQRAKSTDIFIMYVAGHGVTYGDDYYFLCQDALSNELTDPVVRQTWAISSRELTEAIKRIPAIKQVLIFDTCAAGRFIEKLTDRREISSDQIRSLERLKDATGTHILAGCAADAVSYEASAYAQGLLTHSLLMGMRGAALQDGQFVDVATLFNFADITVPQLARDIGGIQRPLITTPGGGRSFPFGQITEADRPLVPLQTVKPMVVRTTLNHADLFADTLKLSRRVDETLRSRRVAARGIPLVFVDAPDIPSGYQIAGKYQTAGDKLTVDVRLLRDEGGMLTPIAAWIVEGETGKLDALAAKIVTEVEARLQPK